MYSRTFFSGRFSGGPEARGGGAAAVGDREGEDRAGGEEEGDRGGGAAHQGECGNSSI